MSGGRSFGRLLWAAARLGAQESLRAFRGDPEAGRRLDGVAREAAAELGPTGGRLFRAANALLGGASDFLRTRGPGASAELVETWKALDLSGVEGAGGKPPGGERE